MLGITESHPYHVGGSSFDPTHPVSMYLMQLSDDMVGIRDIKGANDMLHVFPNPSDGKFTIRHSVIAGQLSIKSMNGNTVYRTSTSAGGTSEIELDVAPGVYIVSLQTGQSIYNEKLIVH